MLSKVRGLLVALFIVAGLGIAGTLDYEAAKAHEAFKLQPSTAQAQAKAKPKFERIEVAVYTATVVKVGEDNVWFDVRYGDGSLHEFQVEYWYASPKSYPKVGDTVEVVFDAKAPDLLLYVRYAR